MYILKNAIISITRNKGRNILIGVIIFVIACACTVTLAIHNTASDLINSYQNAYDKEATISFDRSNMMKNTDIGNQQSREEMKERFNNINSYTVEDIKKFAESKHIKNYYYTYNISLNGNNIEKAESSSNEENKDRPSFPGREDKQGSSYDFTLNGYSSQEAMNEFIEGSYSITKIVDNAWDIAFTGNYVFINEELASYNNLNLNDKIELKDEDGNIYEFEIIGIYKENDSNEMRMFSNSVNTLITNANSLEKISTSNENIKANIKPTFIIDDYKNADAIEKEFYEKGLNENYIVETNEEEATAGISSIQNVKSFATTFLIISLLIGGIVLFIINMINIRERKYEIGVLRTIGISKLKLTMQFVSELLIVGLAALTLGTGLGACLSKNVSNSLLSSEIENTQTQQEEMKNNFGGRGGPREFNRKGTPNVQAYKTMDAVVSVKVIGELLGIGITLILISSVSSMISIQRFTPLTILKERS